MCTYKILSKLINKKKFLYKCGYVYITEIFNGTITRYTHNWSPQQALNAFVFHIHRGVVETRPAMPEETNKFFIQRNRNDNAAFTSHSKRSHTNTHTHNNKQYKTQITK